MESSQWIDITPLDTFIFDVDGVFTDGNFIYTEDGKFGKIFWPHDADGIKLLKKHGIKVQCISADKRWFSITKRRIQDDMWLPLEQISESDRLLWLRWNFDLKRCIYMGDGLYDWEIFRHVGYAIAPNNAFYLTRKKADYVTETNAGSGAVLEAAIHILEKFYNFKI